MVNVGLARLFSPPLDEKKRDLGRKTIKKTYEVSIGFWRDLFGGHFLLWRHGESGIKGDKKRKDKENKSKAKKEKKKTRGKRGLGGLVTQSSSVCGFCLLLAGAVVTSKRNCAVWKGKKTRSR